jgi:thiosulfate dehydrogenase (quinone) large subunit
MADRTGPASSGAPPLALFLLRVLVGWHFLYEGYFKLVAPAWAHDGARLSPWSSAGYLTQASGPLGALLRRAMSAGWTPTIDVLVTGALLAIGLSLVVGLWTRWGCAGALVLLTIFYVTAIPLDGVPRDGSTGAELIVNKVLIEWAAVAVLWSFRAGEVGGIDSLLRRDRGER